MATIEERAEERVGLQTHWGGTIVDSYIEGATDQKKIDIEKAIKAHCSFCEAHNACVDRGVFCCPETEHIKKALEE